MADEDRVAPFDLVVFGGAGDLALRKLLPAMYQRERDGRLAGDGRIVAVARSAMSAEEYRRRAEAALKAHVPADTLDPGTAATLLKRLDYVACDAADPADIAKLGPHLAPDGRTRAFYLATAPDLFGPICRALGTAGLASPGSRVVLEKPLGRDLASSRAVNDAVGAVFGEERVFRIDHYLGKETVQNLMALRFANRRFERLWHAGEIDHVQITVAEALGVEGRGAYYDRSGALRDIVQNHLMQLLCLVAMEPPARLEADAVRDEKVKVLKSLRALQGADVARDTVRGQYAAGAIAGRAVPAYAAEIGPEGAASRTETFVALRLAVDNWRWAGVPFYLRTGKRLAERRSEIVVEFRDVPHQIFPPEAGAIAPNRLVIRLQPDEGIYLALNTKTPTPGKLRLQRAALNLSFAETFKTRHPDAYERLLTDVLRGNQTLFMRRDEVEWAWRWIEPILEAWNAAGGAPKPYQAGSWGPAASTALLARDGRAWREELG
ncbi:MAG: glucose-6-phosphate dehydrogenase [Rhodospirillales bacterium]